LWRDRPIHGPIGRPWRCRSRGLDRPMASGLKDPLGAAIATSRPININAKHARPRPLWNMPSQTTFHHDVVGHRIHTSAKKGPYQPFSTLHLRSIPGTAQALDWNGGAPFRDRASVRANKTLPSSASEIATLEGLDVADPQPSRGGLRREGANSRAHHVPISSTTCPSP